MDIRHLKHFSGIAKYGSFSEAAKRLYISQPALTRSINVLEDQLGTRLFERTPKGVHLTETGTMLHRHAVLILNEMDTAKEELKAVLEGSYGEVHIGAASMFANRFIDKAAANLAKRNESMRLSINIGLYEELVQQLLDGVLDVILSTSPETEYREDLVFEPLCQISSVIVAAPNHPLSKVESVEISDLVGVPWVVLEQPHMDSFMYSFFAEVGLAAPVSRVKTNSLEVIRSIVRQDNFVGFLPSHWVEEDVKQGLLTILPVVGTPIRRKAGVIMRKNNASKAALELLIDELRTVCSSV